MKRSGWLWLIAGAVLLTTGGVLSSYPNYVLRFAEAIATAEGYFVSGSLPNRSNNPGDISDSSGVKIYATTEEGWAALYHQVSIMFTGGSAYYDPSMTILQVAQKYAEDWQNWANNVASYLGVSTSTTLAELMNG